MRYPLCLTLCAMFAIAIAAQAPYVAPHDEGEGLSLPVVDLVAYERIPLPTTVADDSIGLAVVGVDGFVGVLDRRTPRAWVFTKSGGLVRSLSREDLNDIDVSDLLLGAAGVPQIYDASTGILWEFGDQTRSAAARVMISGVRHIGGTPPKLVYAGVDRNSGEPGVGLFGQDGESLKRMLSGVGASGHLSDFPSCNLRDVTVHSLFEPQMIWSTADRWTAAMPSDHDQLIAVLRDTEVQGTFTLKAEEPRAANGADARTVVGEGWRLGSCIVPPEEVIEGRGVYPTLPSVAGIQVSPGGDVWVRRFAAENTGAVQVMSPEGTIRAQGSPGKWPLAFVSDSVAVVRQKSGGHSDLWLARLVTRSAHTP